MFNAALIGLLAGSLSLGTPDGGDDKKTPHADKPAPEAVADVAGPSVFETGRSADQARSITSDTYAFGRPSALAPFKLWATYGLGEAEARWDTRGGDAEITIAGTNGDIISQRLNVGAQIDPISLPNFKVGVGAELGLGRNEFQIGGSAGDNPFDLGQGNDSIESEFGLRNVKVYGAARGRVLGIHGGYSFDLGEEREYRSIQAPVGPGGELVNINIPTTLSTTDGRDAIFVGADFDYPSNWLRLFGGLDYYMLQGIGDDTNTPVDESDYDEDNFLNFLFGAGVKFSIFELGAALQIQTRLDNPTVLDIGGPSGIGGHAGTVAPYLRISPPQIPASLFVKGAVQEEYTEYGYAIGGANSVKPGLGFTAGLTLGFE